jgi:hypothetical protein
MTLERIVLIFSNSSSAFHKSLRRWKNRRPGGSLP